MAASELRTGVTASTYSLEKEAGGHEFEIRDYSCYQPDLDNRYIPSQRFTIGGHDWVIRYYPDGIDNGEDCKDYVGVQLELTSEFTSVRLVYEFRLVDGQAATKPTTVVLTAENPTCGTDKFMKKSDLPRFLRNDSIKIQCYVTIIKGPQLKGSAVSSNPVVVVQVPPSNLSSDLGQLLSLGQDVDITFKVKSEVFRAHKLILGIRCPKLTTTATQPHLDGQTMRDRRTSSTDNSSTVVIEDMEPKDFKALLHFVYTDSLPREHRNNEEMAANLLAAADKYDLTRMKLCCAEILSKRPYVDTVTTTMALAHTHHCRELKDACIQFINSSERTRDDVLKSDGYNELRDTCHKVALEILENTNIFKKAIERQQDPEERSEGRSHRGEGRRGQGTSRNKQKYGNNVASTSSQYWGRSDED